MIDHCMHTCNFYNCAGNDFNPPEPVKCVDFADDCEALKESEGCNSDYMARYCQATCLDSCKDDGCEDKHEDCAAEVSAGFCNYSENTKRNCPKGCRMGACDDGTP